MFLGSSYFKYNKATIASKNGSRETFATGVL